MTKSERSQKGRRAKAAEELTEAEWAIMKVVWEKEPCTAGTVQEMLTGSKVFAAAIPGRCAAPPAPASRSTSPLSSEGSSTTDNPAMETVAGFVPCALFGTRILVRFVSPRSR